MISTATAETAMPVATRALAGATTEEAELAAPQAMVSETFGIGGFHGGSGGAVDNDRGGLGGGNGGVGIDRNGGGGDNISGGVGGL